MGLTSEQVHWLYGAALGVFAVLMLLHAKGTVTRRWPEFLIGGALLVFGIGLIVDPYLHGAAAPGNYAEETAQHLTLGLVLVLGSAFELYRAARGYETRAWRLPIVLALLAAAATFILHAQHDANVSMLLLVTQHRFIAATLFVLAFAVLLAPVGNARAQGVAAPLLTLLLGLELLLYTEGDSWLGVPTDSHHSESSASHS